MIGRTDGRFIRDLEKDDSTLTSDFLSMSLIIDQDNSSKHRKVEMDANETAFIAEVDVTDF